MKIGKLGKSKPSPQSIEAYWDNVDTLMADPKWRNPPRGMEFEEMIKNFHQAWKTEGYTLTSTWQKYGGKDILIGWFAICYWCREEVPVKRTEHPREVMKKHKCKQE